MNDLPERLRTESSLVHGRRRELLVEAAEALEVHAEARRQVLEEAAKSICDDCASAEPFENGVHYTITGGFPPRFCWRCKAGPIRAMIDKPAPDVLTVPREPTMKMQNAAVDATGMHYTAPEHTGWRRSPQMLFVAAYKAMIEAAE